MLKECGISSSSDDEEVNIILNTVEYKPKVIDFVNNVVYNFSDDEVKV